MLSSSLRVPFYQRLTVAMNKLEDKGIIVLRLIRGNGSCFRGKDSHRDAPVFDSLSASRPTQQNFQSLRLPQERTNRLRLWHSAEPEFTGLEVGQNCVHGCHILVV